MRRHTTYRAALGTSMLALLVVGSAFAAAQRTLVGPTITAFSPKAGSVGTKVTITGTGFRGASVEFFGVQAAAAINRAGTSITATVPSPLAETSGSPITVTTKGGTALSTANFAYSVAPAVRSGVHAFAKPRIMRFVPAAGKPGTRVTITGQNFGGALVVKLGGVKATFTSASSKIVVSVPRHAKSGPITVKTMSGTAASLESFRVV